MGTLRFEDQAAHAGLGRESVLMFHVEHCFRSDVGIFDLVRYVSCQRGRSRPRHSMWNV